MREKTAVRLYLTTTQAARLCHLSPSTLLRAIRDKKIKAFSTPGGHFRIERSSLDEFVRKVGMTERGRRASHRVMLVQAKGDDRARLSQDLSVERDYEVLEAGTCFEAGYLMSQARPAAVILDADSPAASELLSSLSDRGVPVLVLEGKGASPDGKAARRLKKPVEMEQLREALKTLLN